MTRNGDGSTDSSRRRFLAGSAAIGALSLAGCAGLNSDGESAEGDASDSPVGHCETTPFRTHCFQTLGA